MSSSIRRAAIVGALAIFGLPAFADGDIAKGERSFKKCAACHTLEESGANRVGPNLFNIIDRKTASIEGFPYSVKMREMGEAGHIWSEEEIDIFVENPKKLVPGTKMTFAGIKKADERADLIAFLKSRQTEAAGAEPAPAADAPKAN